MSSHTLRIKYLVTQFLVLPPLRPVGSALASGLLVFDALWSLDFQVQALEPKRKVETDNFKWWTVKQIPKRGWQSEKIQTKISFLDLQSQVKPNSPSSRVSFSLLEWGGEKEVLPESRQTFEVAVDLSTLFSLVKLAFFSASIRLLINR